MAKNRILIVEDEKDIAENIALNLDYLSIWLCLCQASTRQQMLEENLQADADEYRAADDPRTLFEKAANPVSERHPYRA